MSNSIIPTLVKGVYALYPKIDRTYRFDNSENRSVPCGPLEDGAAYELSFRIKKSEAVDLWAYINESWKAFLAETGKKAEMVNKPFKEDEADPEYLIFKAKLKGGYSGQPTKKPGVFNAANQPIVDPDFQLTTGSTINVQLKAVPFATNANMAGVSLRLLAVQVIDLAQMAGGASPFDADPEAMKAMTEQMGELYKQEPVEAKAAPAGADFDDDIPFSNFEYRTLV